MKIHEKYQCEQCEKSFKYADIKKKHILITHENAKFYCHFYNNKKPCPYDEECVFLHEDSKICKYGKTCERNFCMFKHECNAETNEINVNEEESVTGDDIFVIDDQEEFIGQDNETSERTFLNPSQDDEISCDEMINCEMCDFVSARKTDMMNHKNSSHNLCHICSSKFIFQESLKNHMKKMHNYKEGLSGPQSGEAPR